jgi:nucleotide-binding universal stress UspA family protein
MKQFKNIAYLFDPAQDNAAVFKWTQKIAAINQAKLNLAQIIEKSTIDSLLWEQIFPDKPFERILLQEAQTTVQKFLNKAKVDTKPLIKVTNENPALELLKEITRKRYDLLVLNNSNKNISINTRLLKKCPCPILLGKPFRETSVIRILAAVDPDPTDTFKKSLNIKIINAANMLATQLKAELHILHIWKVRNESILKGPFVDILPDSFNRLVTATKEQYKSWLSELVQSTNAQNYTLHLRRGDADVEILKFVKTRKITLTVMGMVCRTGIEGLFIGNTAEKVSSEINSSLLAIKPDDVIIP